MKKAIATSLLCLALLADGATLAAAQDAAGNDIRALVINTRPLAEGRKNPVLIRFEHRDGGIPVMKEEAEASGKSPLYLLAADPALSDFHVEVPRPMNRPGEYIFTMTPNTDCGYRIWAGPDSIGGGAFVDIPGARDCSGAPREQKPSLTFEDAHYRFSLSFDTGTLQAGKDTIAKLSIRKKGGAPVDDLEPVMGAYASMSGVYDDFKTVVAPSPSGETPSSPTDRGGPSLEFKVTPPQSGFLTLFVKTMIGGTPVTASFGTSVPPSTSLQAPGDLKAVTDAPDAQETESVTGTLSQEDLDFEKMLEEKAVERLKKQDKKRNNLDEFRKEQSR